MKGDKQQSDRVWTACVDLLRQQIDKSSNVEEKNMHMLELAVVQHQLGETDEARTLLGEVITQSPGSQQQVQAQFQLARLEQLSGNPQAAIGVLEQVAQARPNTRESATAVRIIQQIQAELTSATAANALTTATAENRPTTPTTGLPAGMVQP